MNGVDLLEINYWGKPPFFIHYKCIEHEICLFDKNNYPKIGELKINYAYQQNLYTQKVTHIICSMIQKHCGIKLYLCCWSWKLLTNDCLKRNGQTCSWINLQIKDAKIGCCRCYSSAPSVEHLSNIYKYICKTKRASIYATYTYIYDYILIGYFCYA